MKKKTMGKKKSAKKATAKRTAAKKTAKAKSVKRVAAQAAKSSLEKDFVRTGPKKPAPARVKKKTPSSAGSEWSILKVGQPAPAFNLPTDAGKNVSLKDFAGKTVVLYFYPKDDTPGCTKESCDFRDSFARVQAQGAIVLGVSKDSVKSHQKFKQKYSLPFPLVSDETGKMLEAYRVWKEKSMYGRNYMGIDRTTYVIDVDANGRGKIRKAYPKVKVEGHVDEILKDLA